MKRTAAPELQVVVSLREQRLGLWRDGQCVGCWPVSTALAGADEREGSGGTPRGRHRIRAMIGAGCAPGTVFVARRPTGEVYSEALARAHPERDWVLTRILWLCGEQPGVNRLGEVDSQRRFIYIHGCPDSEPMGEPRSHGCVRMRNSDVVELFGQVEPGTPVMISEQELPA